MTTRTTLLISGLLVLAAVCGPPAVAQEDSLWDEFSAEDEDIGFVERLAIANAEIGATIDKLTYSIETVRTDRTDEDRAIEYADKFSATFDEHDQTLETYVNDRFDGNASEYDTIALVFEVGDATETRYIVADANNSTFSNSTVVGSTSRTVDYNVTLQDYAAANAADELEYFAEEYAAEGRGIDNALLTRMGKRYGTNIELPEEVDWP